MKVTASDYGFGMVNAEATTTFTIQNTGKSALTDITVESSDANFTIENAPASVDVDETATVTVKMSAANTGMHEGVITVSAPEQATVTFNVSGYVMDETLFTEAFDGNALPAGWTTTGWRISPATTPKSNRAPEQASATMRRNRSPPRSWARR